LKALTKTTKNALFKKINKVAPKKKPKEVPLPAEPHSNTGHTIFINGRELVIGKGTIIE
jgi:hypothetical protein